MKTGIATHPGRMQPYTLWINGQTVGFFETRAEAEIKMRRELSRLRDKGEQANG